MTARAMAKQIAFRYRSIDSATGIARETAKRLAEQLGVDETQAIHRALHELAVKMLAVDHSNIRWCSDGFEIGCDNGEKVRVAFALDCCGNPPLFSGSQK